MRLPDRTPHHRWASRRHRPPAKNSLRDARFPTRAFASIPANSGANRGNFPSVRLPNRFKTRWPKSWLDSGRREKRARCGEQRSKRSMRD